MTIPANPIQATPKQVCETLLDFFTNNPLKLDMHLWEDNRGECETVACLAGWTSLFHGESFAELEKEFDDNPQLKGEQHWRQRQADRLGITGGASELLFLETETSQVVPLLKKMIEWHSENRDGRKLPKQTMRHWLHNFNQDFYWGIHRRDWKTARENALTAQWEQQEKWRLQHTDRSKKNGD